MKYTDINLLHQINMLIFSLFIKRTHPKIKTLHLKIKADALIYI